MDTRPEPAGFGNCPRCPYLVGGSAETCFDCASESLQRLVEDRCELCELPLKEDGSCGNPLCNWSEEDRFFAWVYAISMRTGRLRQAIDRYKVDGRKGWARIFGRVLLGYLGSHAKWFENYDLIIPSPTFVGQGGREFDHTALVIEQAVVEDDWPGWPFEVGVVQKAQATTPFRGKTWQSRYVIAETELRSALNVPEPDKVRGQRVLVYDDVYTEGLTLREVASVLLDAGAIHVAEVVLARQPYGGG